MRYFAIFYVSYIGGLIFPSLAFAGSISEQLIRCANNAFKFCAVLITRKSNYSIFKFLRKDIVILFFFFNLVCFLSVAALVERAEFSMSRVESSYESVHEELEMDKGLSRNVLKGVTANLEEEKRNLDFQLESALPLTSNNINVAQGFSCERTSGLYGFPDLPAPRRTMIPPLPPMLATSSSPPPAYERAASPPPPPPTPPLPPGLVTASSIPPVYERGAPPPATELLQGIPLPSGLAKASSIPPARASRPPPSSIPTSSLLSEPDAYCMSLRSPARESEVMTLPRDRRRRVEKSVLHLEKPDGVYYRKARLARIPMEKTKEKTIVPPPGVEQDTTDKIRKSAKSFPASQRMLSPLKVELGKIL